MRTRTFLIAAAATALAASPTWAHPKLVAATPAPNAKAAATNNLRLTFSEGLVEKFSGVDLLMTDMPGMKMVAPMKVAAQTALAPDGKSLIVSTGKPLATGTYRLDWHVVSTDTHRVKGSYVFRIG